MDDPIKFIYADRLFWKNLVIDYNELRRSDFLILLFAYHNSKDKPFHYSIITSNFYIPPDSFKRPIRLLIYSGYVNRLSTTKYVLTQKGIDFCLSYIDFMHSNLPK